MTRIADTVAELLDRVFDPLSIKLATSAGICAVATGQATLSDRPVAFVCSDFGVRAGSVGADEADQIVSAVRRATECRLPVIAFPRSGGTRMQDGTPAFARMIDISRALLEHRTAGLPYLVHLRHPTTGGVLASWAAMGQVTSAEPNALIGFMGPRVHEALGAPPLSTSVQRSENLLVHGLIDAIVPAADLRRYLIRTLAAAQPVRPIPPAAAPSRSTPGAPAHLASCTCNRQSAWNSVLRTRRAGRPGLQEVLAATGDPWVLHAAGYSMNGGSVALASARFGDQPALVVGNDRSAANTAVGPADLAAVIRAVELATQWSLPLVTLIDTNGAQLSRESEEAGLASQIARCIQSRLQAPIPLVSVLLGEGTGGGALAMLASDRVLCATNSWLSPLPLEGASAILYGDDTHAAELATVQRVSSHELVRAGIADDVIDELPDASDEPAVFAQRVVHAVDAALSDLSLKPASALVDARWVGRSSRTPEN